MTLQDEIAQAEKNIEVLAVALSKNLDDKNAHNLFWAMQKDYQLQKLRYVQALNLLHEDYVFKIETFK